MADKKIAKRQNVIYTETANSIAQALYDLENNVPELKKDLKPLQISDAKEVGVNLKILWFIERSKINLLNFF